MKIHDILSLFERCQNHLDGCSHGYPEELWDDLLDVIYKLKRDIES